MSLSCLQSRDELFTVKAVSRSHSYHWTIENFKVEEPARTYETKFEVPNVNGRWALEFRGPNKSGFWKLLLKPTELFTPTKVNLRFHAYILSAHARRECNTRFGCPEPAFYMFDCSSSTTFYSKRFRSFGYPKFASIEELLGKSLIHHGGLTIVFDVQVFHGIQLKVLDRTPSENVMTSIDCQLFPNPQEQRESPIVDDLRALYKDSRSTDIVIHAEGRQFLAHSVLLIARSSVFRAMFNHDMIEKTNRRIEIEDIGADVVDAMLYFIYTDEIPNIDALAKELLGAADKYDIPRLKSECQRHLIAALDVENAAAMLALADAHDASELQSVSIGFIARNVRAVRKTEGWNSLTPGSKQKLKGKVFDEFVAYAMDENKI